jgi:hypothetical protein
MASLVPVLELTPGTYATRERPRPSRSGRENPEGWYQYWSESLGDAGIRGLTPWTLGSYLVTIDQLRDPQLLATIISIERPDLAHAADDEVGALSGGYVLSHGDAMLLPGCCSDLGNLADWRRAATEAAAVPEMVWIGHPWTFVRASGDILHFTEPTEQQAADGLPDVLSIARADLLGAIDDAQRAIDHFADELRPVVHALAPRIDAARTVDLLLGRDD